MSPKKSPPALAKEKPLLTKRAPAPTPIPPQRTEPAPVQRKRPGSYHHGDLRRALMDAALALVRERGPGAFKLVEICRAAGVSQAAFYRHFETREQLLADLATEGFERLRQMIATNLGSATDPGTAVRQGGIGYLLFARDFPGHLHLMFNTVGVEQAALPRDPRSLQQMLAGEDCAAAPGGGSATEAAFAAAASAGQETFAALVGAFARLAQLPGKPHYWPSEAAPAVAVGFWAMVHGVAVLALEGQLGRDPWGQETQTYLRDWLLDPWLKGLAVPASKAPRGKER